MPKNDGVVEVVAKVLYETQVQRALEAISKLSLDLTRVDQTFNDVREETDRSCAITIFALIDEIISDLFLLHVNLAFGQGRKRLFAEFGLLPTASRRIQMLFALNWISYMTCHDLNLTRKIRNEFAHRSNVRAFGSSPIKSYMAFFKTPSSDILERVLSVMETPTTELMADAVRRVFGERSKYYFLIMSCIVLRNTIFETLVMPIALRHQVDHRSIVGVFPDSEGILRSVHMTFARILLDRVVIMNKVSDPDEK